MKKLSLVLIVAVVLAASLLGVTAFASSGVSTNENIYIGEYAHQNLNNSDPNVVIVFGTASVEETDGVTERGIVVTKGTENWYFPAKAWDEETGNFGVAIIRSTIEKGDYVAKAYAKVDGVIEVGDTVSLNFNATLAQTQTDVVVNVANPVDLKNLVTVENGNIGEVTYSVSAENGEIVVENGVVSYGNKAGRYTATATHMLSGNSVTFNVMAYDEEYEITDKSQLASLADEHANSYVKLMNDVFVETADMVEVNGYAYVIGGEFNGFFDGQNNEIKYDFRKDIKDLLFKGLFRFVSGEVKNLKVEGFANLKGDNGGLFVETLGQTGLVENCYINVASQQSASEKGNWNATQAVIISNQGLVKDCVIDVRSNKGGTGSFGYGIGLQQTGQGVWQNIASIIPTGDGGLYYPWVGGAYGTKLSARQLVNVVYYKGVNNFIDAVGDQLTYGVKSETDNGDGTFTPVYDYITTAITEAQTMGEAWSVDATGASLNGELVAPIANETDKHVTTETGSIVFVPETDKTTEQIYMGYKGKPSIDYVYSSSDKAVATVSGTGLVTKVGVGTAIITARHVFTNNTTRIPVTVAEVTYAVDSAEDLALLTPDKATELGAKSTATVYAYLTKDVTVTKADMVKYKDSSNIVWYCIIPSGNVTSDKESTADALFSGVLDGKGYKLTFEFEADGYLEAFGGITYGTNTSTIIRNLSYEGIGVVSGIDSTKNSQGWRNFSGITYTNKGFIDNCFINAGYIPVNMFDRDSGGNHIYRNGTHARLISMNSGGILRNSIVHLSNYRLGAEGGGVLVINSEEDAFCENVAGVLLNKAMATMSGVNYTNAYSNQIRNICYYASFDKLIEGSGTLVTITNVDSTSKQFNNYAGNKNKGTAFTGGQGLTNWTMNSTDGTIAMNVDGDAKVVYTKSTLPAVTISSNNVTSMVVGETIQLTALEGGVESNAVRFVTNKYKGVATITQDGRLKANGAGTVNVYAVNPLTRKLSSAITITITDAAA